MSLIAGYIAPRPLPLAPLRAKLDAYSMAGNTGAQRVWLAEHGSGGHLFAIGAAHGIAQPRFLKDPAGNLALSIGYMRPGFSEAFEAGVNVASLTDFEGEYCLICSCFQRRSIHLVNDRFAARPLFVFRGDDRVVFATDLNFLLYFLGSPPPMDRVAWYELFKYGHTLGARTTFTGISKLAPATEVRFAEGRSSEKNYWTLRHEPQDDLDLVDFSARAYRAFERGLGWREALLPAARRRVISLSGGLDSRLVAGAMGRPRLCTAITRGEEGSRETRVAAEVAGILGMRHERLQLQTVALHRLADDLIELTGGMLPIHHPAKTLQRAAMLRREGGFAFGGEPGDVLVGSYIPSVAFLNPGRRNGLISRYCKQRGIDDRLLRRVFERDTFAGIARAGQDHLRETFAAVSGPTAAHMVTAWAMSCRQPSFSFLSPYNQCDDILQVYPHLDYHYNDLLLQLPAAWLYQERFYKAMIFHGLPALQGVPYANTGELLTANVRRIGTRERVRSWLDDSARAVIPGVLMDQARRVRQRLGGGEVVAVYDYLRRDEVLISAVREALHSCDELAGILDVAGTRRFIDRCVAGEEANIAAATEVLGSLVTLTYWYRKYFC